MEDALANSELQSLRNRFRKDAEFVLRGVSENDTGEKSKCEPIICWLENPLYQHRNEY